MILLSVGLHSAIALFPVREVPELPEQAIAESLPPFTVTRLPDPPGVAVPDSVNAQSIEPPQSIEPQPAPQIVIPQPVVPDPAPPPVTAQAPIDVNVENASEENVSNEDEATGDGDEATGGEEQQSSQFTDAEIASMADVWEGFLEGLVLEGSDNPIGSSNLQQTFSAYFETEKEDLFFDAENIDAENNKEPKVSVVSHHLLEGKTPEQVFEDIVIPGLLEQEGFEVQNYGEFADGPVYKVVQGEIVHYLNIVPLNGASILIVCDRPPNAEGDAF